MKLLLSSVMSRSKMTAKISTPLIFMPKKKDGTIIVRECVWRKNLSRPTTAKLLDISRNYWLSKNVEDWGIVIEKEDPDESE